MQKEAILRLMIQGSTALILAGTVSKLFAGGEAIGFAVATGSFQVDSAEVYGNTTLFDGVTVSTAKASSRLELTNGARMTLGADSQARISEKRMTLERGTGELRTPAGYRMDAGTLRISPLDPKSIASVKLEGPGQVLVSAVNGRVRVLNEAGQFVANVEPGSARLFTPQAVQAGIDSGGVDAALALRGGQKSTGPGVTESGSPPAGASPRPGSNSATSDSRRSGPGRPYPTTGSSPRPGSTPPQCCRTDIGRPYPPTGSSPRSGGSPPAGGSPPSMPSMSP